MLVMNPDQRRCPYCAEIIQAAAIKCKHCGEEAYPKLMGLEQGSWLERLESEHDNLRAALSWSLVCLLGYDNDGHRYQGCCSAN